MKTVLIKYSLVMLLLIVSGNRLLAQNRFAKHALEGLNYSIDKLEKDSTNQKGPAGIRITIPHDQFDNPEHVILALMTANGETVFSFVAHEDLLSGGKTDTLNVFEIDKENFVFNVRNVPPKKYKVVLQVLGANGSAQFVNKEEDWWTKVEEKTKKGDKKG
jgi:hypothetical protein